VGPQTKNRFRTGEFGYYVRAEDVGGGSGKAHCAAGKETR